MPSPTPEIQPAQRQIRLIKDGEHHIFRYTPGQEVALFEVFADLVLDPDHDLDGYDAAALADLMGRQQGAENAGNLLAQAFGPPPPPPFTPTQGAS